MARYARKQSNNGIYHVMLRGINQSQLFYDNEDRKVFLKRLARFKEEDAFLLYAYSLMGNHIHLLLKEGADTLALIIKRLTVSYASWFNAKYSRSGYLFQGRYKSEPVEDEAYLLTVFKYIHHNPIKIGEAIDSWTSYNDYISFPELVDTDFILDMFSADKTDARKRLRQFLNESMPEEAGILGVPKPKTLNDEEATQRIKILANLTACNELARLDRARQNRALALLKREGFTIGQISRLTGIIAPPIKQCVFPQRISCVLC